MGAHVCCCFLVARTLRAAAAPLARNILSGIPIFLAAAVACTLLLGGVSERFDGLAWTSITLFAAANGDVVRETMLTASFWTADDAVLAVLTQAGLYVFVALAVYVLLRTTTAISEQAFLLVRPPPAGLAAAGGAGDAGSSEGASAAAGGHSSEGGSAKAEAALPVYRLPKRVRALLAAMQGVAEVGGPGALERVSAAAAAAMPARARPCCEAAGCCLRRACPAAAPPCASGCSGHRAAEAVAGRSGVGGQGGPGSWASATAP